MPRKTHVSATINGEETEFLCEPRQSLLEVLRETLGLMGAKEGCNNGNCGACNVILDGKLVNSCLVLAVEIQGRSVTTIEGIAQNGVLTAVQKAWIDHDVPQCGYCQSGQIMSATALLRQNKNPSDAEIDSYMQNLCRCGTYIRIRAAIKSAAQALNGSAS